MSSKGWECHYYNKLPVLALAARFLKGKTNAKRDGCDFLKELDFNTLTLGTNEVIVDEEKT